jgi:hypothetical protein
MAKDLKICVIENKNPQLKYPHLKQSTDYPGLIMLFTDKNSGIVLQPSENPHFKIGVKYNDLLPEAFKVFKGIVTLTQ